MSYTAELESPLIHPQSDFAPRTSTSKEQQEQPSAIELFSYAFCCATQGLVTILYIALVVFVPIALSHGIFAP